MAQHSNIEWTFYELVDGTWVRGYTFNPWIGCQSVSPGCDHCYAERMNKFYKWNGGGWGAHAPRKRTSEGYWRMPLHWARRANGVRPRVFCASLADVFDNQAPDGAREDLFALIRATPQLDWMLLTKRPENIAKMLPTDWGNGWPNVWLGTTCEDQHHFYRRWPILRNVPAVVRFVSYEPALGPLEIGDARPHWIICGGESGGGARPMDLAWARALRDECSATGVAFFLKQMTRKGPIPDDLLVRQFPVTA